MEGVLAIAIFGSFFGFLYPLVVGIALGICVRARRNFRPRPGQWLPFLVLPAATYYFLAYLVSGRQGWNVPYAVLVLSAAGALIAVAACIARRPAWLRAGTLVAVAVAFTVWRLVPYQGMTRLF